MSVRYILALAACFVALATVFVWFSRDTDLEEGLARVRIGGQTVRVTIADTPVARAHGLSGRASLASDEGMLFVFEKEDFHSFWMKDMLFSIDIIWFSSEKAVVDIAVNVSPDTFPAAFLPRAPARYVLELPAGFVEEYTVQIGDVFEL